MEIMNANMTNAMNASMMDDALSEPSSPESAFDDTDLLVSAVSDDVTAQLVAAGPVGIAAAAAIATGKKRKRPHSFETNPSIRKRQQTRLFRKLRSTIEEYTTRVGQQAVVLCCVPGKPNQSSSSYKVFGSQPLESVIRNSKASIMQELDNYLAQQAPMQSNDSSLYELPPLVIDGIPTPVDKMTQAQLRNFIPEMLKYSTCRGKPGWGKIEYKPIWWPDFVPWANVRSDVRSEHEKKKVSWTHALRTIVIDCYKHHGRDDLLPQFQEDIKTNIVTDPGAFNQHTMVQTINNPDGTLSIIQIDTGDNSGSQMVTLADGTQAQIVRTLHAPQQEATRAVQTLADVAAAQHTDMVTGHGPVSVQMNNTAHHPVATITEASINQEGHLVLTNTQGLGMVTIPVSMYQSVSGGNAPLQVQNVHVAMMPMQQQQQQHNGDLGVPDATHAVEVMTVEPITNT